MPVNKVKIFLASALLFGVIGIGVVLSLKPIPLAQPVPTPAVAQQKTLQVSVDYAGKKASASAEVTVFSDDKALGVLQKMHQVEVKHYSFGDLVQNIDGVAADASHFWIYYVNGKEAQEGASSYLPKKGDQILWRLEAEKK